MRIANETPFEMERAVVLDKRGAETLVVVLKGTWTIKPDGTPILAERQCPIAAWDSFHGPPESSSIKDEAELGPLRPSTDCFLVGSVRAPDAGTRSLDVLFRAGPVEKRVRVFGERRWKRGAFGLSATEPEPFESVPLTWELAYGGRDTSHADPRNHGEEARNPVGRGFRSARSELPLADDLLPQLEDPTDLIRSAGQPVKPAAFAPIGRVWEPRRGYAGTYDQQWIEERMPILPEDFDPRFHQSAPVGLTAPRRLEGGELVEIVYGDDRARLRFALPRPEPTAYVSLSGPARELPMAMDSMLFDLDSMQLRAVWKVELDIHRRLPELSEIACHLRGDLT
jgi:hypothetical protein